MKAVRVDQIIMLMVTVIINVVALTGGGQEVSSGSEGSPVPTTYTTQKSCGTPSWRILTFASRRVKHADECVR